MFHFFVLAVQERRMKQIAELTSHRVSENDKKNSPCDIFYRHLHCKEGETLTLKRRNRYETHAERDRER